MKKKKGFTLVELLAVIVILAVILVIAVPQIMSVIESARKGSIESTAKLIAEGAEREYTNRKILGKDTNIECSEVANLNDKDYGTCSISFDSTGKAKVTITGKGKFEGYTCKGNSTNMECVKGEALPTDVQYFSYGENAIDEVTIKDKDKCVAYITSSSLWDTIKANADTLCTGGKTTDGNTMQSLVIFNNIPSSDYETAGLEVTYGIAITGYNIEGGLDVVIPSEIDGKKVVAIGANTFKNMNLTRAVIPNTVTMIYEYAFSNNQLKEVTIPSSITYIMRYAFRGNQLTNITFSSTSLTLACMPFYNNPITNDSTYTYPDNITIVDCPPN